MAALNHTFRFISRRKGSARSNATRNSCALVDPESLTVTSCHQCGAIVEFGAVFCGSCGAAIDPQDAGQSFQPQQSRAPVYARQVESADKPFLVIVAVVACLTVGLGGFLFLRSHRKPEVVAETNADLAKAPAPATGPTPAFPKMPLRSQMLRAAAPYKNQMSNRRRRRVVWTCQTWEANTRRRYLCRRAQPSLSSLSTRLRPRRQ